MESTTTPPHQTSATTDSGTLAALGTPGAETPEVKKLDLSKLSPPDKLEGARLEEITIDGICGVY